MGTITELANRALQHCGATRITAGAYFTESTKNAAEVRACFDSLRRSELERNVWVFSIRTAALRPVSSLISKVVTFGTYDAATTYAMYDIVKDSAGRVYFSIASSNLAHTPESSPTYWELYAGPDLAREYVTTYVAGVTYALGDHTVGSDSAVYKSLANGNIGNTPTSSPASWELTDDDVTADDETYYDGELVYIGNRVYQSLESENEDAPGTSKWQILVLPTVARPRFNYPIDATLEGIYRLPVNHMRKAVQDPKGQVVDRDWMYEGQYITTSDGGVLLYRFAADVADTEKFSPLFFEALAVRIALEVCEILTQSNTKLTSIASKYTKYVGDARTVNAIQIGPIEDPEDELITVRL